LEEIYKQQVVSLVTALEVYLREMFIFIIDEKKVKSDKLLDSEKKELSLLDVIRLHNLIKKNRWKPAELLANEYNFQNFDEVKSTYNKLLNIDIIAELKKYKLEEKNGEITQLEKDFDVKIKEILELRHSIIHDINFSKKLSYEEVSAMFGFLHTFVDIFDAFLSEKYS
jgi:hypothetical protein